MSVNRTYRAALRRCICTCGTPCNRTIALWVLGSLDIYQLRLRHVHMHATGRLMSDQAYAGARVRQLNSNPMFSNFDS